jgi:hypothetical protein
MTNCLFYYSPTLGSLKNIQQRMLINYCAKPCFFIFLICAINYTVAEVFIKILSRQTFLLI